MEELLSSSFFRYGVFPLGSVLLGAWVKFATRNDQYAKFRKEDFAVGLELFLTACLMFVVLTTDKALALVQINKTLAVELNKKPIDQITVSILQTESFDLSNSIFASGWIVTVMFIGLWGISTIVRLWGWKSATELTPVLGIALPIVAGVSALLLVMAGEAP